MKLKVLLILGISFFAIQLSLAQRGGAKIAYIDSEYILKNVPEYQQATSQLASKVKKWKVEVEGKLNKIKQQRVALTNEKALLTQELYDERLEDLEFEEKEIVEYQQKRFGPNGDLVIQRKQLMQPVQDQIFQAVQDISEKRNYDFVFDKSADVVMLYSAEKYDISDVVLRLITRSSKRKQAESRKERREAEEEIAIEEEKSDSQIERQRILDEKKAKRDSVYAAKRAALKAERDAARAAKLKQRMEELKAKEAAKESGSNEKKANEDEDNSTEKQDAPKSREQLLEEKRAAREADKKRRQKALEDKRKAREEELKKAREEKDKDNPK